MLKLRQNLVNKNKNTKVSYRSRLIGLFMGAMAIGFIVPAFTFGTGNTASAVSTGMGTSAAQVAVTGSTTVIYAYKQMSISQAYPYYATAAFITAGGLSLYALTYLPGRSAERSRYASRFTTVSRTSY